MDIYQLHCFCVVAENENITQAAQILHISQPALSQTIRRLEENLGYELFVRTHKSIHLNVYGRVLYKRALHFVISTGKRYLAQNFI